MSQEYIIDAATRIGRKLEGIIPRDHADRDEILEFVKMVGRKIDHLDDEANTCTTWTWPFPAPEPA